MLFYEWDYDQEIVTAWERTGTCNQCGVCCTYFIKYRKTGTEEHQLGDGVVEEGIWFEREGRYMQMMEMKEWNNPCKALRDGLCTVHENKPEICSTWPMHPSQLLAGCSYEFREVRSWTFQEVNN